MKYFVPVLMLLTFFAKADYMTDLELSRELSDKTLASVFKHRTEYKNVLRDPHSENYVGVLSTLLIGWELADGVNGIEIGDTLILAWLHNPEIIATWFDSKEESRKRWLKGQDYLFNGFSNIYEYQGTEELRLNLLKKLKAVRVKSKSISRYIQVLENLKVPKYN